MRELRQKKKDDRAAAKAAIAKEKQDKKAARKAAAEAKRNKVRWNFVHAQLYYHLLCPFNPLNTALCNFSNLFDYSIIEKGAKKEGTNKKDSDRG